MRVGVEGHVWQSPGGAVVVFIFGFLARLGGAFDVADAVVFWLLDDRPQLEVASMRVLPCDFVYACVLGGSRSSK